MSEFRFVDLFCGGGGSITGAINALRVAGEDYEGRGFNLWYREIKASGYSVEMEVLNAADYGAATSRERLIVQAVRKSSGSRIVWPEPTHTREPGLLSGSYRPWRSAAEIIDWSIPGESIFDRKKPLCTNTLRRIEAGIRKYWGAWSEPFIVEYYGQGGAVPLNIPLHTVTTKDRFGVVEGRVLTLPSGSSYQLDITHRMLTARELAAATSFPENYVFCGGDTAAKKQIGNAVPPVVAEALYRAVLAA